MTPATFQPPADVRRIAVPVLAGMGNGLMAQPMVRRLAAAFPGAELTVLARNRSIAAVFERLAEVRGVLTFGNEPAEFARLIAALRGLTADLCVIPYPSNRWQYSLLAGASGARRTILHGYDVGWWKAAHFLARRRVSAEPSLHDVAQNLRLLEAMGLPIDGQMAPIFPIAPHELARARELLPDPERAVAIHAGSGDTIFAASKRWSPEKYALLIERLRQETRLVPVLLEGPEDAGVAQLMGRYTDLPTIHLDGPLAEAAALLAACRLYVGTDSGLAHLAAAVGTRPVTLFGPARPDEVSPFGHRHLVVQTPAPCAPCFRYPQESTTPRVACRPPYCIDRIEVGSVMAAVRAALDGE